MFKKLLSTIIFLLMTFNVCYADNEIDSNTIITELDNLTGGIVFEDIVIEENIEIQKFAAPSFLSAEEYIRQQLFNHAERVNLIQYRLTLAELANILSVNKDFMVASGYIRYDYVRGIPSLVKDRIITYYQPDYLFDTKEEDVKGRNLIDSSIEAYAQEIKELTDKPLGRLLLLHDKLIENCEYDDKYQIKSFSVHSVFADNEAVCQGYAQAMYFIGKELGLDIELCSSFDIGHVWNYIKLGDEYYHVDTTWDDPVLIAQYVEDGVVTREERVHRTTALHKNFLMCDETMQSQGTNHGSKSNWFTTLKNLPVCDSKKYEHGYFFNIPNDVTVSFHDGNYELSLYIQTYTGTKENKVFCADDLYTGSIITSYPEENDDFYFIYCYMIEDTQKFNMFVKTDGNTLDVVKYSKIPSSQTYYKKQSLTGQKISKSDLPEGDNEISVYLWDMETMKPLSRVIPINR